MTASTPQRAPRTGDGRDEPRVLGPYEILTRIAAGGMSVVYLARRTGPAGFRRVVALKVCRRELSDDPEFVRMFLTEARLAAAIHHPHVVPILEVTEGDPTFLVMEYVEGASLQRLMSAPSGVSVAVALRACVDALRGLHAAHELTDDLGQSLGVVHRDVSPHNILVGADGRARITDFGVARAAAHGSGTAAGVLKGKTSYMAPEQLRQEPVDRRADVFAAGVVLWEALTGTRLFQGNAPAETMAAVLSAPIHAPSMIADGVPEALDAIVLRALSRDVETRWKTAADFANAISESNVPVASPEEVHAAVMAAAGDDIERLRSAARAPAPGGDAGAADAAPLDGTGSAVRVRAPRRATWWVVAALVLALAALAAAYVLTREPAAEIAPLVEPATENEARTEGEAAAEATAEAEAATEAEATTETPAAETEAAPAPSTERDRTRPRRSGSTMRRRARPAPMESDPDYMPTGI